MMIKITDMKFSAMILGLSAICLLMFCDVKEQNVGLCREKRVISDGEKTKEKK